MIFALALAASTVVKQPTMPQAMRGIWDLPNHCPLENGDSDSRIIVRINNAAFVETVFEPKRILIAELTNWTAVGEFSEEGEVSQGRLTLHLSKDGKMLSYITSNNKIVRLIRCSKSF